MSVSISNQTLALLEKKALELGFEYFGTLKVAASQSIEIYEQWLEKGYAGNMDYLHRHAALKTDVRHLLPEARSIIVLGMNYNTIEGKRNVTHDPACGVISRYALGDDYHQIVHEKLKKFKQIIEGCIDGSVQVRPCVDSAPILEREYAQHAGIGWIGKHSGLIHGKEGSWFFLAEVLIDLDLPEKKMRVPGSCGSCTRCIDICPTQAIVADRTIDSRLCISYLTIELKGAIPVELRSKMGNLIFGCDLCQDICPWNNEAKLSTEPQFKARPDFLETDLKKWMGLSQKEFSKLFKKSPVKRAKRRGLLRNIAVALGNWGKAEAIPALQKALHDEEVLIRRHAAWALGQIRHTQSQKILEEALHHETHSDVQEEIRNALRG